MTDEGPGVAEMFRLLTRIDKRLDDMDSRSAERERHLVRQDVFDARQTTDDVQMRGLEGEVRKIGIRVDGVLERLKDAEDKRRADRTLLLSSLAFPLLLMILGALFLSGT